MTHTVRETVPHAQAQNRALRRIVAVQAAILAVSFVAVVVWLLRR